MTDLGLAVTLAVNWEAETMARKPARRDRSTGSVFERTVTTPQGKTITRHVAVYDRGYIDGKRVRVTRYGTSRQDALEKLNQVRRELDEKGMLPTSDPTVAQWLTAWLEEQAGARLKPQTLAGYRSKINGWLIPVLGRHKLSRLSAEHVRGLIRRMLDEGKSPTHVLGAYRVLASALADAVREEKVARNVAKLVRPPKAAKSPARPLTLAEAVDVLTACADDRLASMWFTGLLTGLRQGERLGLTWEAVDLEAGVIDIAWALARVEWRHGCRRPCGQQRCPDRKLDLRADYEHRVVEGNLVLQRPKTERSRRVIPLPDLLLTALKARYEAVLDERGLYEVDHGLVWCRLDGGPLKPRDAWQAWRDLLNDAGAPTLRDHDLRHTAATLLQEMGVDEHTIMQILGHSTVAVDRSYRHISTVTARSTLTALAEQLALPAGRPS